MPSNSMNVINYNRNQLPQRDRFKTVLGGCNSGRKTEYYLPKASTKQLKEIGRRLREERKVRMLKVIVVTFVLLLVFYCVLVYSMDGIIELLS